MPMIRFAYVMAVRRAVSGWRLESVLFVGILLAVALMASGVIFSDLLSNASLRHELLRAPAEEVNITVRSFSSQDEPSTTAGRRRVYQERLDFARNEIATVFAPYINEQARVIDTATFYFKGHPQLELDNEVRPRGSIIYMSGFEPDRITVLQGSWPGAANAAAGSDTPMDVAVDTLGLELLGLEIGQTMEVFPAASFTDPPSMTVRIAAEFERVDPEDEFWFGVDSDFSLHNDRWTIIPLFATEAAVMDRVLGEYPTLYTDVTWYYYLDREELRAKDVGPLRQTIFQAETNIRFNLKNSSYTIRLDNLLNSFDEQLLLARVPLFLVVFLMTGILLYYLALVAGLIVRSRSSEISMLKSRGATTAQVGMLGLGEGLLVGIPAVIIGPFLAMGVVRVLGKLFFSLGGGADELTGVPVTVSQGAIVLGLIGGALAVLVFTFATLAAARHGIVEARQTGARPPTASFLHRYYLDFLLLALIGLLWWQIQSRGSFLVQSVGSQQLELDYSLLLGPALGLVAVGLVIMRVFPWFALILSRLAGPVAPAWLVHALRHVARDPMVPGILIVLLTMSTAMGVIGSAFSSTLERSQEERSLYAAGADLRVRHSGVSSAREDGRLAEAVQQHPAVLGAAEAYRTTGQITTTGFSTSASVLAMDASRIADVAWFRDDLADGRSINELAELLLDGPEVPKGLLLPSDARGLAIWVQPGGLNQGANLWARLRDARGLYFDVWLGGLAGEGWHLVQSDLTPVVAAGRRFINQERNVSVLPPFSLQAFQITDRFRTSASSDLGAVFLGRIDALTPNGPVTVADFQDSNDWSVIQDFARPGLYAVETSTSASGGQFPVSTRYSWAMGGVGMRGLRPGPTEGAVPAVVNQEFLELADASVGDDVILGLSTYSVMVNIAGVADYFPTMDPGKKPFVLMDLGIFEAVSNQHSPIPLVGANEIWLDLTSTPGLSDQDADQDALDGLGDKVDTGQVLDFIRESGVSVREVFDADVLVAERVDQPLVNAGWGALLVLLFLAVALATGSGVMLFSFLDTKERQTEYALLRTLGSSGGQLRGIVWFNLFLIVICGVVMGTWVGQLIGTSLLPLMEVAEEGERVTPPMAFTVNWLSLAVSYGVLALVTVVTVLWLAWLSSKIQVQQVLRMGDAG